MDISKILQELIFPVSKIKGHPLGTKFIHNILRENKSVFENDLKWSGPDYCDRKKREILSEELLKSYPILNNDPYDTRPLLYSWILSTTNNKLRKETRIALTQWAFYNVSEYIFLLDLMLKDCKDPQVIEDLYSILYGLSTLLIDNNNLIKIKNWITKNNHKTFNLFNLRYNIVIRQCSMLIMQRLVYLGLAEQEDIFLLNKPYKKNTNEFIELDKDLLQGDWNPSDGAYPIEMDLFWYVIKNAYDRFWEFSSFNSPPEEGNDLLKKYENKYEVNNLSIDKFVVAAIVYYLKKLGWNQETHYCFDTKASHGAKSKHVTFVEKYVWLGVHYLKGYFADTLPFLGFWGNKKKDLIKDYSKIISVPNPAVYINSISLGLIKDNLPEESKILSSSINIDFFPKNNSTPLEKKVWINNLPNISPSSLLNITDQNSMCQIIYQKLSKTSEDGHSRLTISLASLFISQIDLHFFLDSLIQNKTSHEFDDLIAKPNTNINVRDIGYDFPDSDSTFFHDNYEVFKTLTSITYSDFEEEKEELMPSYLFQNILGVKQGDGVYFGNSSVNPITKKAEYYNSYEDYNTTIISPKSALHKAFKNSSFKLFWLCSISKRHTLAMLNENPSVENVMTTYYYIIYEEDSEYIVRLLNSK